MSRWLVLLVSSALVACSDSAGTLPSSTTTPGNGGGAGASFDGGSELRVPVPASGRVHVKLGTPAVVTPAGDPRTSFDWDLAFEGFDVYTNGGRSGGGKGAAFGPLDAVTFVGDTAPQVPFLVQDKAGGAFLDWYAYDASSHSLWSRYHLYGVKDGDRLWKVQILTYYGQRDGATVSALYRARYAEVTASGSGPTLDVVDLDGTAGGVAATETAESGCLDLASGQRVMLSPEATRTSADWHLCFRRDSISVNGELGGPRGVTATDLDGATTATEALTDVKAKTSLTELAAFDAADAASFTGKNFRGDRIVTAFSDKWIDPAATPIAPAKNTMWLVLDAAGTQKYFLGVSAFENPTATSPGTVVVRIKPVKG